MQIELTDKEAALIIMSLNLKASRKIQSINTLRRKRALLTAQVGEKEYKHRIKLRVGTINSAIALSEKLLNGATGRI